MDTHLLPTGAPHPGHGRPVAPDQAGTATTTADTTASDSSDAAAEGVEITISAEAAAVLAASATPEGPGKSGASPAHMARGADGEWLVGTTYEALVGEAYKNFGQLVSAIAHGLDVQGTEEPAADPASDGTIAAPETTEAGAVVDETEETTDAAAEEAAAPDPVVTEDVVVDTEEAVVAEVVDTEEPVVADPVVAADSLEDTLLEALEEDGSEVV